MDWIGRIGRRIKLRDLHILMSVAETGSMAKAADRLAISQPVISKAIADLEHAVGVSLFDRGRRGVEPTVYGHALLASSRATFDELRQGVQRLQFLSDPTTGELRIGMSDPMTALVSAMIDRLSQKFPQMTFHVTQAVHSALHELLRERAIDLMIGGIQSDLPEDLHSEQLFDVPLVAVAGGRNRWMRRRKINLSELANERWILWPPESVGGAWVVDAFRANGLELPRATVITLSMHMRNNLLATGRFLTMLPGHMLKFKSKHQHLKQLNVELPATSWPVGLITLRNRTVTPTAKLFMDSARLLVNQVMMQNGAGGSLKSA
jgi:DNA-binding transcriptional LysR family regulator